MTAAGCLPIVSGEAAAAHHTLAGIGISQPEGMPQFVDEEVSERPIDAPASFFHAHLRSPTHERYSREGPPFPWQSEVMRASSSSKATPIITTLLNIRLPHQEKVVGKASVRVTRAQRLQPRLQGLDDQGLQFLFLLSKCRGAVRGEIVADPPLRFIDAVQQYALFFYEPTQDDESLRGGGDAEKQTAHHRQHQDSVDCF